jgi:hypothetical protein
MSGALPQVYLVRHGETGGAAITPLIQHRLVGQAMESITPDTMPRAKFWRQGVAGRVRRQVREERRIEAGGLQYAGTKSFSRSLDPVQRQAIVQWCESAQARDFRFHLRIDQARFVQGLATVHDTVHNEFRASQTMTVHEVQENVRIAIRQRCQVCFSHAFKRGTH